MNAMVRANCGGLTHRAKRWLVDALLEPLIPLARLEAWLVFWARWVFRLRKPFVIAVTGSVGKSTTTAMVAAALGHGEAKAIIGPVASTFGNMNDDVGVSATLLRFDHVLELPWAYHRRLALFVQIPFRAIRALLGRYPRVTVLEIGVGDTADFSRIVTIAPPNIAIVTNIGPAHLDKLKSLGGVVDEKGKLARAVPVSGLVILGEGHAYVSHLEQMARAPVVKVSGRGAEMSRNIAREVCRHMKIPDEIADAALDRITPLGRRLNRLEFAGMTIIDDTYNANPLSMQLGLDTLTETAMTGRRRLAILGHMSELGDEAPRYHKEMGIYARGRADLLIGVGELSRNYAPDHWFATSDACADRIEDLVRTNDCVLVKGSASSKMWHVTERLREIAEKDLTLPLRS
jgi:UDP-N-acetylmuramoyl-tripeptide--D-alanyl-D-alanine ligase